MWLLLLARFLRRRWRIRLPHRQLAISLVLAKVLLLRVLTLLRPLLAMVRLLVLVAWTYGQGRRPRSRSRPYIVSCSRAFRSRACPRFLPCAWNRLSRACLAHWPVRRLR